MMGASKKKVWCYSLCLLTSVLVNVLFFTTQHLGKQKQTLTWTQAAAEEAESVARISCSGHGRAYLDGLIIDRKPICECNACYGGPDCSVFSPDCPADADSGDPLFLEPFWRRHPATSAVVIAGWHRMSYTFSDTSPLWITQSRELENHIRRVHLAAANAITEGKYVIFGAGSTQLLGAAVYALSMNLSSPAAVVAASPSYPLYKTQTDFFRNAEFEYKGDANLLKKLDRNAKANNSIIEFVTSPNNPDGNLRVAVLQGASVRAVYDHAYYWPHFTAVPAPADEDIMIFTISKLTGHAGTRFGWAFIKDENVYQNMQAYIRAAELGISREAQLRALKLMKTILQGNGTEIFNYAYHRMSDRWEKLSRILSFSKRFSLQEIPPRFCNFFRKVRGPSPAYAWLKCEREGDTNCKSVLRAANIIGREGSLFNVENRYVRLSLLKSEDDFNLLLSRLNKLVAEEDGVKTM